MYFQGHAGVAGPPGPIGQPGAAVSNVEYSIFTETASIFTKKINFVMLPLADPMGRPWRTLGLRFFHFHAVKAKSL